MGKNGPNWASQHLSIFGQCTLQPLVWDYDILTTSRSSKILLLGQKADTLVLDDLALNSGLCLWQDYTLSNFLISGFNFFICKMDVMTRLTSPVFKGWHEVNPERQHDARYYAPEVGTCLFLPRFPPVHSLVRPSYSKQHTRPQIPRDGNHVFFFLINYLTLFNHISSRSDFLIVFSKDIYFYFSPRVGIWFF